jgi:hypothetical protein
LGELQLDSLSISSEAKSSLPKPDAIVKAHFVRNFAGVDVPKYLSDAAIKRSLCPEEALPDLLACDYDDISATEDDPFREELELGNTFMENVSSVQERSSSFVLSSIENALADPNVSKDLFDTSVSIIAN